MTKASDNDFPSLLLTEQGSAPSNPAASHQRMYIRTSDHTLVTVNSSGTVASVGGGTATSVAAHGCRVYRASGDFSIGNNTFTAVQFTAESYDTDTIHDNSTNNTRLTIPSISGVTTGLWAMRAAGYTTITTGRLTCVFKLNGSSDIGFGELQPDEDVGPYMAFTDYVFTAGDYVECMVRSSSGSASISTDGVISPYFSIAFLGKVT